MPRTPSDNRSGHLNRTPINGLRNKLVLKGIPDHLHPCWVNDSDEGENIQMYLDAGYSFWTTKGVTTADRHVNNDSSIGSVISRKVGNGITAFAIVCPMEIYLDECKRLDDETTAKTETMFRGLKEKEGRYGNIKQKDDFQKS